MGKIHCPLSYCWDLTPAFKTTSLNYEKFKNGIPYEALTSIFQDAVTITRALGVRYLWIDALCIIQYCGDSILDHEARLDWEWNSAQMCSIYSNAYVTIFAASRPDSNTSILKERPRFPSCLAPVILNGVQEYLFIEPQRYAQAVGTEPVDLRAWAYQETLLSPRLLIYRKHEMVWQCNTVRIHESGGSTPYSNYKQRLPKNPTVGNWFEIVKSYTSRALSKPQDKLPALSGLAQWFHRTIGGNYLAGLWEVDLFQCLLWRTTEVWQSKNTELEQHSWRARSWSWASWNGGISFISQFPDPEWVDIDDIVDYAEDHSEVRSCHVKLASPDPFGSVASGILVIRGPMIQCIDEHWRQNESISLDALARRIQLSELDKSPPLFALLLQGTSGLILQRGTKGGSIDSSTTEDRFERVGIFQVCFSARDDLFYPFQMKTVAII